MGGRPPQGIDTKDGRSYTHKQSNNILMLNYNLKR